MSGTIGFREATRADRDSILALRALAFPDDDPEKQQPDFWEWEFVDGYAGQARVFVAEDGERIVGHFAFIPQQYSTGGLIRGALAVDVMTHPQYRRQKIFSRLSRFAADRVRSDFQVIIALHIRKEVVGGMLAGGWRPAQHLPVLLKPLSIVRILRDFRPQWSAAAPGGALRGAAEGRGAPLSSIRPITDLDQIDVLLETNHARQTRGIEFLDWRYRRNRHWPYRMEGFFEGDELRAFVVHREAILKARRSLAIADAGCARGREALLQQLVKHVCAEDGKGLGLAAALMSREHPAYGALRKSGFIPGPHRFRLLVQIFDEKLRHLAAAPWSLSWGDTDHL